VSGSESRGQILPVDGCGSETVDWTPAGGCSAGLETAELGTAELFERLRSAEERINHLERSLASARQIGVAVGLLAHRYDCTPEGAWQLLVRLSQVTNVKVRELSRILGEVHAGRVPPADTAVVQAIAAQLPEVAGDERSRYGGAGHEPAPVDQRGEYPGAAAGSA
jgi:hypothetical protein